MVDLAGTSKEFGRLFAQFLDTNRDGRVTSREQFQPLIDSIRNTPPEKREELSRMMRQEIDARLPPGVRANLSPETRRLLDAGMDFAQTVTDPQRLEQFCASPSRIAGANEALASLQNASREATSGMGNYRSQEEIAEADRRIQEMVHDSPELQELRGSLPPGQRRQMDAVTSNLRMDTIQTVLKNFRSGLQQGAPQGFDPLDTRDVCHGLNVPTPEPSGRGSAR